MKDMADQSSILRGRPAAFVREYLIDLNPTAAARRAGYAPSGASRCAGRLLRTPLIKREIKAAMESRIKRTEVTQDLVIEELARIAFGNLSDVMSWGPDGMQVTPSKALTPHQAAGVMEVSPATGKEAGTLRLKRHDKVKALELLGRHLGVFSDKVDVSLDAGSTLSGEERIRRASALMALAAERAGVSPADGTLNGQGGERLKGEQSKAGKPKKNIK